jgi:hypothetical protein
MEYLVQRVKTVTETIIVEAESAEDAEELAAINSYYTKIKQESPAALAQG